MADRHTTPPQVSPTNDSFRLLMWLVAWKKEKRALEPVAQMSGVAWQKLASRQERFVPASRRGSTALVSRSVVFPSAVCRCRCRYLGSRTEQVVDSEAVLRTAWSMSVETPCDMREEVEAEFRIAKYQTDGANSAEIFTKFPNRGQPI